MIITIDGVSWLGKSYIGKKLAEEMGINFFSTGILVRFVANKFVDLTDRNLSESSVIERAVEIIEEIDIRDVMECKCLYTKETEQALKIIAKYPFVDARLKKVLKEYTNKKSIVLDGRFTFDIFPNAHRKYYFKSTIEKRAELVAKIKNISQEDAINYINYRDSFEKRVNIPESVCILDPFAVHECELIKYMMNDIAQ